MTVDKTIKFILEPEEAETLFRASDILQTVCEEFDDCEDCPLLNICDNSGTTPYALIRNFARKNF